MASGAELALKLIMTLKDEVTAKAKPMQDALKGIGTVALGAAGLAAGGIAALAAGLAVAGKAAAEEQVGIAALGAAVSATGADWDVASSAIEDYLEEER